MGECRCLFRDELWAFIKKYENDFMFVLTSIPSFFIFLQHIIHC